MPQPSTPTKTSRIGARMRAALIYVSTHPGCTMNAAAIAIGPHNSNYYGYAAIQRTITAGLIRRLPHPTHMGRTQLFLTYLGKDYLPLAEVTQF